MEYKFSDESLRKIAVAVQNITPWKPLDGDCVTEMIRKMMKQ